LLTTKTISMKAILISLIFSFALDSWLNDAIAQEQQSPAFNHVYLAVHNMDSSLKFYTKAFDLKVTDRFSQLDITQIDTSFKRAVNIVFLKFPGQDFVYELAERADTARPGNLFQHVGVEVKNIAIALQRAVDAGGKMYIPIRRIRTSSGLEIKQAFIKGPDGESIELTEIISGAY
jgi:catechol 2,3-dioxygenase-like lactoylglutathione lyase family enzyme